VAWHMLLKANTADSCAPSFVVPVPTSITTGVLRFARSLMGNHMLHELPRLRSHVLTPIPEDQVTWEHFGA
jgi:hypothetical protein